MLKVLFTKLWQGCFPSPCLWCSLPTTHHQSLLCQFCHQALPRFPYQLCHYNLLFLPKVRIGLAQTSFDQLLSLSWYQQPYQHWITAWKFNKNPYAGKVLRELFANLVAQFQQTQPLPQALLYVPMSPDREQKRGFNQAKLLAESAAATLNLPVLHCLYRTPKNTHQVGLGRLERQRNLQGAFILDNRVMLPAHVALVDDVVTTGSTANQIGILLKQQGVQTISLWTLAVTPSPLQSEVMH